VRVDPGTSAWRALRLLLCGTLALFAASSARAAERRPLAVDDYLAIREVGAPRISPDGRWIAYAVTTHDLEEDESRSRIWMVPAAGGDAVPLTAEDEDSSSPRWSPDGRYLGFLSARGEEEDGKDRTQVFTLFREGGEAEQVTDTAQKVEFFEWSPDGKRILLVLKDPKPEELEAKQAEEKGEEAKKKKKTPPPWVVTRRQFKEDYVGYLDSRRNHLYVLDLATRKLRQITSGDFDDYCHSYLPGCEHSEPAWSPDGRRIAFVRINAAETSSSLILAGADGSGERALATRRDPAAFVSFRMGDREPRPAWSPDGRLIAAIGQGGVERHVVVVDAESGVETAVLDSGGFPRGLAWLDASSLVLSAPPHAIGPLRSSGECRTRTGRWRGSRTT
jgi:dipeptidyl aminopeptidase/acylaminoacyl peptidase